MSQTLKQSTWLVLPVLVLSLILTCEDNRDKYGSVKIQIVMTSGTDTNSGQNNRITGALSSDVTNITITISGVEPVNVSVTSGETVTQTIDGVPLGEQTVKIDLKDAGGIILYTQTQTVTVEAEKTASPTFPADDFTAENVEIALTSPNGGETWDIGSSHEIIWTTSHSSENVAITLYKNSASYQVLSAATASTGSFSWTIADTIAEGSSYTIRVALVSDLGTFDESNNTFTLITISQATIAVTSPNGGETWELSSTHDISWASSDVSGNIKIELYQDGSVYQTIVESTDDDGSYSWTIPDSYDEDSNYKVRISSVSDGSVYDDSDNTFNLTSTSQPTITVTSPNGGETWELGSEHNISWTSSALMAASHPTIGSRSNSLPTIKARGEREHNQQTNEFNRARTSNRTGSQDSRGNVKIELYQGGSLYQTIVESTDDDGSYSWTIPDSYDEGSNYKVRISSVTDGTINDESDDNFTLFTEGDIYGCTDPYAANYNPDATMDDGSCAGYPDNGEYSLSFDGTDDWVEINEIANNFDEDGEISFVIDFMINENNSGALLAINNDDASNENTFIVSVYDSLLFIDSESMFCDPPDHEFSININDNSVNRLLINIVFGGETGEPREPDQLVRGMEVEYFIGSIDLFIDSVYLLVAIYQLVIYTS